MKAQGVCAFAAEKIPQEWLRKYNDAFCLQAKDAWLCSGSLRLLSGDVSNALARKLGWREPLSVSTLGTQLVEIGKMHAEVRLMSEHGCSPCENDLRFSCTSEDVT